MKGDSMTPDGFTLSGPMTVAVVGAGTIGASWAALFLARGLTVRISDPDPAAEASARRLITAAWPALTRLGLAPGADPANWTFHTDLREAARGADLVQENGPEREEVKRALFAALEEAVGDDTIIASSTSGLMMSRLQAGMRVPGRFVIGHPFNPPHLIPLVEVVGGRQTDERAIARLTAFYTALGKRPIRLHAERPGHLANRLQAALWREAVNAVATGLASVEDVDAAIAYGPGLRWALMGPNAIFDLAGGPGGMAHFLGHLGPAMESWWADLGTPQLTEDIRRRLVEGTAEAVHGRPYAERIEERDRLLLALVGMLARERGDGGQPGGGQPAT